MGTKRFKVKIQYKNNYKFVEKVDTFFFHINQFSLYIYIYTYTVYKHRYPVKGSLCRSLSSQVICKFMITGHFLQVQLL